MQKSPRPRCLAGRPAFSSLSPRTACVVVCLVSAGRGTAKERGFDEKESPTALPSWQARFQFPLPAHRLRGGLFGLCGERLGEGNCHHLMQRQRTHFPAEPKEGGSKIRPQISAIFYPASFTNHQASKSTNITATKPPKISSPRLGDAWATRVPETWASPSCSRGVCRRGCGG
jgi:hypothetical protein